MRLSGDAFVAGRELMRELPNALPEFTPWRDS
jgi:hypothetical protein